VSLFKQARKVSLRCVVSLSCAALLGSVSSLVLGSAGPWQPSWPPAVPELRGTAMYRHHWGLWGWVARGQFSMCICQWYHGGGNRGPKPSLVGCALHQGSQCPGSARWDGGQWSVSPGILVCPRAEAPGDVTSRGCVACRAATWDWAGLAVRCS